MLDERMPRIAKAVDITDAVLRTSASDIFCMIEATL